MTNLLDRIIKAFAPIWALRRARARAALRAAQDPPVPPSRRDSEGWRRADGEELPGRLRELRRGWIDGRTKRNCWR